MQLFLINANTALSGHRRLYARLAQLDSSDCRHIFIVPDRYTLGVEHDLCENYFKDGYTRADVLSFTRLAVKTLGKKINKCLSKEGTVILLEKVMASKADCLKYYKNLKGYGFAKEMFAALASLRAGGVTPDAIEQELENVDGVLHDKLSDIAVIGREYERVLAENYTDTVTRIDRLIECVKSNKVFSDAHFYILGFNLYSSQQIQLIKSLLENCLSVNISYVGAMEKVGCPCTQIDELADFCRLKGIPVGYEEAHELVKPPFNALKSALFGGGNKPFIREEERVKVRLFSEETPYAEVLAAAREIVYLTRKENYRFKDVAVVCNDSTLLPIIRENFLRCGISGFLDEGYRLSDGLAARYIFPLLDFVSGKNQTDAFKLVRHPFSGIAEEQGDAFERYCVRYNIKYRRFNSPFTLGEFIEAENVRLDLMNTANRVPEQATVREYCALISEILRSEDIAEVLEEYASADDERLIAASKIEQFLSLTEEISLLNGDSFMECGEFSALLRAVSADIKIVLKPDYIDTVFVGNTEESRFSSVKALFVLGAADGFFPVKSGDGLIFTAMDNELMRRNKLTVFPSPVEKNAFERFILQDLLTKPTERLYIGCAETTLSGDTQIQGEGFKELLYLLGSEPKNLVSYRNFTKVEELNYRLVNLNNAYTQFIAGDVPTEFRESVSRKLIDAGLLKQQTLSKYNCPFESYFKRDNEGRCVTSVSQLECYFSCPFKHFMRYGLRAGAEEDSVLKPSVMGNIIHNVLESFFKRNIDKVYTGEDLTVPTAKAVEGEFQRSVYDCYYADPVSAHILKGVKKECYRLIPELVENMRASDFRPIGFEVGFGYLNDDNLILIKSNNRTFKLCGKIDRVDINGSHIAIVDYKTGTVTSDLKDVRIGKKIQLYVYLSYYLKKGYKPAGVFYLPIKSGNTVSGRSYAMTGQLIDDTEIYAKLDNRVKSANGKFTSKTLDFKAEVTDGEIKLNKSINLLSERDFYNIDDYVTKLAEKGLEEIMSGYAEKKPLKGECNYCEYRAMCGEVAEREKGTARAADFELQNDSCEEAERVTITEDGTERVTIISEKAVLDGNNDEIANKEKDSKLDSLKQNGLAAAINYTEGGDNA